MELTFLVDNNSLVGTPFQAESALSMYIREGDLKVLFDTGYSDAFMKNAGRKDIDLLHLDWVALSHGHYDHTWGLDYLIRQYFEAATMKRDFSRPGLVAHPMAFPSKRVDRIPELGILLAEEKLSRHFDLTLTDAPMWLSKTLVTLGEVERTLDFEPPAPLGERLSENGPVADDLPDDTAMACVTEKGLVVISGCAHAGICNTVEHAKKVTGAHTVRAVVGGFHLLDAKPERLEATADYLADLNLEGLYACHCTDLAAKVALAAKCPIKEVGAGMTLGF